MSFNFGNVQLGTITARPFNDANANGVQNVGEILVSGWSFTLTGTLVNGTAIAPINISSSPTAVFSNLYPGTYALTETNQAGFAQSTPNPVSSISLPSGGSLSFNFGNFKLGTITARPFNDSNSNGIQDAGEALVSGWSFSLTGKFSNGTNAPTVNIVSSPTAVFSNIFPGNYNLTESDQVGVFLDSNLNGILNIGELGKKSWPITLTGTLNNGTILSPITVNSSSTGSFAFNKLSPGTYTLTEADVSGWVHTSPKIITSISIGSGTVVTNNFGNVQLGTITARNGDLAKDGGEINVPNWNVTLTQNGVKIASKLTDVNGTVLFNSLTSGIYNITAATPGFYVHTQPLNGTYSVNITSIGGLHLVSLGIFNEVPGLLTGFGDITTIAPESIVMDSQGFIYDTDVFGNAIKKFAKNGTLIMTFGSQGSGPGQFINPAGIALDSQGNIYVTDLNQRVQKFDPHGNFIMQFGSFGNGPGQFSSPRGISVDPQGNIYVADGNNHRIQKFNSNGNYLLTIGKQGVPYSYIRLPFDVEVIDSTGTVYVADTGNDRIQKFDVNGNWISAFGKFGKNATGDFLRPRNVAVDTNGFIYVSDTYNNRIQIFDSNYNFVRTFGSIGSGPGQFLNPSGLIVDNGIIYVADISNDRIESFYTNGTFIDQFRTRASSMEPYFVIFDQQGHLLAADGHNHKILGFNATTGDLVFTFSQLGTNPGDLRGPRGIGIDSQGNRIVAEDYNNRVSIFDPSGNFLKTFGSTGTGPGQFKQPRGILIDSAGNILVADTQNSRIQKFTSNGTYITQFATFKPYQIAFDAQENIYCADETAAYIEKLAPNGTSLARFGINGTAPGQLNNPRGVYIDNSGNIWVSDSGNNRIQKFDSNFNLLTILGSGGTGTGQFSDPRAILVDSSGNLWVDDTGNLRIQEFDSNLNFVKAISFAFTANTNFGPVILADPPGGTFNATQHVTLSTDEPSVIYYTTDGSTPTQASPKYTGTPIAIGITTTLNAFAIDVAGAVGGILSQIYTIDATPPTVTIIAPSDGAILNTSIITINGNATDSGSGVDALAIQIDGGSFTPISGTSTWSFTTSALSDGQHTISVRAKDNAGNVGVKSITITINTGVPTISITTPSNGAIVKTSIVQINGTASDVVPISKVEVQIDGGTFNLATGTSTWSFTTSALSDGTHTINAKLTDNGANTQTTSSTVTIDTVSPTIAILAPSNGTIVKTSTVLINGTASDVGSGLQKVEASVDGGPFVPASGTANWSFAFNSPFDGSHTIVARATDNAGNTVLSLIAISVDTHAPIVFITLPVNGSTVGSSSVPVTGTAFDAGTGIQSVQVSLDNGAFNLASGTSPWSFNATLVNGQHKIQAKATDNAGNFATSTINVTVNVVQAPVTITTVTNPSPRWGVDSVFVSGNVTGSVAVGDTIFINWGDGASTTGITISGGKWGPVSHIYGSSAIAANPNLILATWISSSHVTKGTSIPSLIMVAKHTTGIALTQAKNLPWGKSTSFTAVLVDADSSNAAIPGKTIHFNGTGVIGVADQATNGTGFAISTGTAPSTVSTTWTYQSHFAGDSLYLPINSAVKVYSTTQHHTFVLVGARSAPWGGTSSFISLLKDADNSAAGISGKTIHFNGTGVIGVADQATNGTGFAISTGTAPSTVANGWTVQAHFAGDSLYFKSDSVVRTYSTLKHGTALSLSLPTSVNHGNTYSVFGTLRDGITGATIASKTITFTADAPIVIPSTGTSGIGNYAVSGLTAPSAGSYNIQSHFAEDSLYLSSNSPQKTLVVK
ncbi:MAG: 6-bladed beta-propeller [Thaumarchaeota archaeon]|nr:6-bladed beta-propeller [Nitrososphaerota archaeon]